MSILSCKTRIASSVCLECALKAVKSMFMPNHCALEPDHIMRLLTRTQEKCDRRESFTSLTPRLAKSLSDDGITVVVHSSLGPLG